MRKLIASSVLVLMLSGGAAAPAWAQKEPRPTEKERPTPVERSATEADCERRQGGTFVDLGGLAELCLFPD
jgi:hypothetical protein